MKTKLTLTAIFLALVVTLAVSVTATIFETGISQQKAYADKLPATSVVLCPGGYHWSSHSHTCVTN